MRAPSLMSDAELERMRAVEDELWWYRALRRHVIRSIATVGETFELLDAGCGTGGMLAHVCRQFPRATATGLDFSSRALELTQKRNLNVRLVQGSADALPFDEATFDVVLSLDILVLRGLDHAAALREMHRVLRPGGTLLVNVAAFDLLRGSHDEAVNMARRFTRPQLRELLAHSGFHVRSISYWNMSLTPAIAVVRWSSRRKATTPALQSDLRPVWPPLNRTLTVIANLELALSRHVPLPFGSSLFAVATK